MLNQILATQTFCDHQDQPSFGRKACFWILVAMGILALIALCLVAFGPVAAGKSVSTLALEIIKAGVTLCGLFYGAAQVSKGMSQMGKPPVPDPVAIGVPGTPIPSASAQPLVAPTPIATEPTTPAKA